MVNDLLKLESFEKIVKLFLYAQQKGWDASINLIDKKIIVILNPTNKPKVYEGEFLIDNSSQDSVSILSGIETAIAKCKQELVKDK